MESLPGDTSDDPCDKTCDTVELAQKTPHKRQPYRQLGLTQQEYDRIVAILQRRPTDAELAMYSVMWSEHCSYKSSKKYLRYFGHTTTEEMKKNILAGIGENAGVIDIGNNWAVTFKVESHNHPSFIEPYQGAATGVGGIVRDIIAMGARPIAVMDQLRFGAVTSTDTFRIVDGVVRGIAGYANSLGLPNIGGETVFDASYNGNPLVNVLCVGVMPKDQIHTAHASGVGNRIILFGARTGLDGIGGVSVLASETFGDATEKGSGTKKLPSVQVGDSFVEKLLIECCQELFAADVVVSIQDLGGAGLSCATSELAAAGEGGMYIDLDRVPLRTTYMTAAEILSSESQERMCAVVTPENVPRFLEICARWEILATDIGYVNDSNRLTMSWHGHTVVDVPPRTVAHEGPEYDRPIQRPASQDTLNADSTISLARPRTPTELRDTLLAMISSPHLASKRCIIEQYDRYVRGNTILAGTEDAGMIRVDETTGKGIALATDCSGRYTLLDPYRGAQLALAEAYRNVSCSGAVAQAVTNCLNFGSPEDPGVMWQLQQAIYGLADGCAQLGIPVISGNVSLYNQTGNMAIMPTPVVGVLGVIEDVQWRTSSFFSPTPGDALYLLGNTYDEFDGSAWAQIMHDHLGGIPPRVDLAAEKRLASILCAAAKGAMISSAHDLSEGGLWQAIVESALGGQQGCRIIPPKDIDPFVFLLSESSARVLISVPRAQEPRLIALLNTRCQPYLRIGVVDQVPEIQIQDVGVLSLAELSAAYESALPKIFGRIL